MGKEEFSPQLKPAKLYWFTWAGIKILLIRSAWRFFVTGKELRGDGDNATFFHDATVDHRGRPYEKLTRARWRRVAFRWLAIGIPVTLAAMHGVAGLGRHFTDAGWARWPWLDIAVAYALGALVIAAGLGMRALATWWPLRELRRELVRPAAEVLCRIVGAKVSKRKLHHLIDLPPGFGSAPEDGAAPQSVRVHMPVNVPLDDKTKERIAREVGARLGLPNAQGSWVIAAERPYVDLLGAPLPPRSLVFAEVRDLMLRTDLTKPLFGLMEGRRPSYLDYYTDSPHVLGSAAAGAGKSAMLKMLAMQRMRHGAGAIFLDFKKWSHLRWVRGLPDTVALYFHQIPEIHNALVGVMEELIRRKDIDHEDELDAMRTLDVYVEEMNTLLPMLRDYWRATVAQAKAQARAAVFAAKNSGDEMALAEATAELAEANGMPITSPAEQALKYGVNMGREFKIHFHFIGQSMSANAAAGRDTRASFRTRLLARWDRKDWRMLAEGVPFVACPAGPVGLWAHVHGAEVDIVRVPWVTDVQARDFVLEAPVPLSPVLSGDIGGSVSTVPQRRAVSSVAALSEIVNALPAKRDGTRLTLKALRLAADRPGFPEPAQRGEPGHAHLYAVDEVLEWFEEREGAPAISS
jgi:hypothetical protein